MTPPRKHPGSVCFCRECAPKPYPLAIGPVRPHPCTKCGEHRGDHCYVDSKQVCRECYQGHQATPEGREWQAWMAERFARYDAWKAEQQRIARARGTEG